MAQRVVQPEKFPSDRLLEFLSEIQLLNMKITRAELRHRNPNDFRKEVNEAVRSIILSTIGAVKSNAKCTSIDFPLSEKSFDEQNTFTFFFANRLIRVLQNIVGHIDDGKDDTIIGMLYKELAPIGARQEIKEGGYIFLYENRRYTIKNCHAEVPVT